MDNWGGPLVWRVNLTLRRAARERRRRLDREFAAYRTRAERDDLFAAIARCESPAAEEIRRLVVRAAARADADCTPYHLRTRG